MLTLTIDNPQIESYFSNSAEKLKAFLESFVKDDDVFTLENEQQYKQAINDLTNGQAICAKEARTILGL